MRALLEAWPVVAVADEHEQRVDPALPGSREHREQVLRPLDRGHPAEPADDELLGRDPVPATHLRRVAVEDDARLELDPEPHDRELALGRHPKPDELVAHLGADGDQPIGDSRQSSLDHAEEERSRRSEVPAEHVAVERVDDDRPPAR